MLTMIPTAHKMMKLFERLVALRRREPDDRVISALVNPADGEQRLKNNEILAMIFLLLLAGHETTTSLIGSGALALVEHPDQKARLIENPELAESAVEEFLRYASPVTCGAARIALEDVELGGALIPRGAHVFGMLNSANHDERVFANPDQLDIGRQPNRHVAFGMGIHLCLGLWLARLEGKIAMRALVQRFPNMRLAVPRAELRWKPSESLRGLRSLPLHLEM
jgi:cytochrome P450 PksS